MNKGIINILLMVVFLMSSSCEDWLTQEDPRALSPDQAYASPSGINSVSANLYSRLRFEQDFGTDIESYDLTRWDEATNNSAYWTFAANVGNGYRSYYDYGLIRDINKHIVQLGHVGSNVTPEQQEYFVAEARFLRAMVYFKLVKNMGGVPIIEEVYDYTTTPQEYARARNTEEEVYDYIAKEIDEIADALDVAAGDGAVTRSRATKGAALALKSRAMLYAGSLALNYDKSTTKGLNLPSGATGIPKEKANEYFQKSLDAYSAIKALGYYSLYQRNPDLSTNFYEAFVTKNSPELIFYRDYDGSTDFKNGFTGRAIARSQRTMANTGSQINPVLNLVEHFELLTTHEVDPLDAYAGNEMIESLADGSSTYTYNVFDNQEDIFADRDPRLNGTIIYPGSTFRGKDLHFQAGLAIKTTNGYEFKSAPSIDKIDSPDEGYYNGVQMTGFDGPHRTSTYVSHTGFLLRKFVDATPGSEASGASTVPYIIFRYGEVLLNAAEAAFELNKKGEALDLINEVRARAGGEAFKLTSAELTRERIRNERTVELAFENHRFYDLKRWRIADEIWSGDRNSPTAILFGLWPYKIYAPNDPTDGKWIYRKIRVEHRGNEADKGMPINFGLGMYYATYPMNEGNPLIERNPNH